MVENNNIMATVARQVVVGAGDDHVIAVQKELVVDRERGIAAEVEKIQVAVDMGDGNIAVHERQRIVGAVVAEPARVSLLKESL